MEGHRQPRWQILEPPIPKGRGRCRGSRAGEAPGTESLARLLRPHSEAGSCAGFPRRGRGQLGAQCCWVGVTAASLTSSWEQAGNSDSDPESREGRGSPSSCLSFLIQRMWTPRGPVSATGHSMDSCLRGLESTLSGCSFLGAMFRGHHQCGEGPCPLRPWPKRERTWPGSAAWPARWMDGQMQQTDSGQWAEGGASEESPRPGDGAVSCLGAWSRPGWKS